MLKRLTSSLSQLIEHQSFSGFFLILITFLALCSANSPLAQYYCALKNFHFTMSYEQFQINLFLPDIVNEGLMSLFFFLVGLEIKYEVQLGELSHYKKAALPGFAALGGMLVPAFIFFIINIYHPENLRGFSIPMATDIAFSLAIANLLGKYVTQSQKVFLTALAIIDDLGAVILIALFYNHHFSLIFFIFSIMLCGGIKLFWKYLHHDLWTTFLSGCLLWYFIFLSGLHSTISGVILGFLFPLGHSQKKNSLFKKLVESLNPWVHYFILPLFAFVNAGISFSQIKMNTLTSSLVIGIALALVLGKPLGIFSFSWFAVKTKLALRSSTFKWKDLFSISILCGIGFTMSLFMGLLAFNQDEMMLQIKLAVLISSVISAFLGLFTILFLSNRP